MTSVDTNDNLGGGRGELEGVAETGRERDREREREREREKERKREREWRSNSSTIMVVSGETQVKKK